MKVTAALFSLAFASFAAAQDLGNLPSCAQECATPYLINGIGNCNRDPKCICKDETFVREIQCCLLEKCEPDKIEAAAGFAVTFCQNNGATNFPTKATCATAAANTGSTSASATAVVTTGTGSTAATTITGSSGAAVSSAASSIASAASSAQSSNPGPRQTAAACLGAIGGLMAAVALL
ncbi:hypothetical protein SMACR_08574 [Sordaria macrospora]|uniref:WGS project CABT00000000 data, contig 2.2 n=2 Tax=Sordaria macrospora TaxID=5147 RepID=F7VML2_SORMK|nr:uncharacterized protein SMAC_08574 [Sordaria macrospora k-hell]KAA8633107.1 hypothetical protein SMACR_08574 [Sordaria macrospora]KAH7625584.1 hypothetical protein B0T09DRAFT_352270 [Sordaria sp. MPI-SDFR-AT-0083]WPJ62453.1 hypothetical protein SMAC4_08574 [Sordaria macrospora]CCC07193.1 unnamed protein product [Sordaria macrospora k-hell]